MKCGIVGQGRMGQCLKEVIQEEVVGIVGRGYCTHVNEWKEVPEVIIDFSHPSSLNMILEYALNNHCKCILGSTGYSEKELSMIEEASRQIAIVVASNFSVGISVLKKISCEMAKALPNFDIELSECHHANKIDAPSGTSLMLYEALNQNQEYQMITGRNMQKKRDKKEIGIHSFRGGNGSGVHTILFLGNEESIECVHRITSKETFIHGALKALEYIQDKQVGCFTMDDVIWN